MTKLLKLLHATCKFGNLVGLKLRNRATKTATCKFGNLVGLKLLKRDN